MQRLLVLLFLFAITRLNAQSTYALKNNLYYYADEIAEQDVYKKRQCRLDVYYPEKTKRFPTVIWFHGGGLEMGAKEIPAALKNKGCAVIGVGYRLSPNVKSPTYIEDAAAAVAWVFRNIETYGGDKNKIMLSGHSAGGYLDLMLTLNKSYLQKYGVDADSICGVVPFSAQCITHFTVRKEQGISALQPRIDSLAPLFHVRKGTPPILLITGDREKELFGRYEENAYLQRMLKLVGNTDSRLYELQGFDHGGMAEPAFPLLLKEIQRLAIDHQK